MAKFADTDLADDSIAGFRIDSFAHVWTQHSSALRSLGFSAVALGVVYLAVNIFLNGGIIGTLAKEGRVSRRRSCYDSSRYLLRYVRLFVVFAVVVALLVVGYKFLLADRLEILQEEATTGRASFLWSSLGVCVVLVLLSLTVMVFDYAKIRTVIDGRRCMTWTTVAAFVFSFRRSFRTVPLFALNLLILGLLFLVYLAVENQFSNATPASMWSLFAVQQVLILTRIWMRLSFFASQLVYYQSANPLLPAPVSVPPSQPVPTRPAQEPPEDALAEQVVAPPGTSSLSPRLA